MKKLFLITLTVILTAISAQAFDTDFAKPSSVYTADQTSIVTGMGTEKNESNTDDLPKFQYDHRSGGERLKDEFSIKQSPALPNVRGILTDTEMSGLVESCDILKEIDRDLGNGTKIGNSRSVLESLAEIEPQIADMLQRRGSTFAIKREAFGIVQKAYLQGKAKFIKNHDSIPK